MTRRQFRVLYREFLFRIVDRDLLSAHAKGDLSQLLLQIVALLAFLSVLFSVPALTFGSAGFAQLRVLSAWSLEHFLIATTMLVVGVFAVLSWGSVFPDHRDVLVLAPLPIRARTLFVAKVTAIATALALTILVLHVATGVIWPLVLAGSLRGDAVPAFTSLPARPPVGAADLQAVMDADLAEAVRHGPFAPGAGGGLAIGIYKHGVRRTFAYGAATPSSLFEIGSVTKTFTGVLLGEAIERRQVRLDTPIRELVPGARIQPPRGDEITLLDLVTHHSGLPTMASNFHVVDRANPYAVYDVVRLYAYLATRGTSRPSDAPFRYSNIGFGLLGHALANRAGVDYGALVREVITEPLAMHDTVITLSDEHRRRFLQGHNDERAPVHEWDLNVLAGAGALRSTVTDMLVWVEANLHPERLGSPTLAAAIRSSHQRRVNAGPFGGIGLAWMQRPHVAGVWHGGATAGFTSDAWVDPGDDTAVVILANVGPASVFSADVVADHVRARLQGTPAVALAELKTPTSDGLATVARVFVAYWLTMIAAGVFVFSLTAGVQGLAASVLPRRAFLRASSFLQLAAFCLFVGVYVLQSMAVSAAALTAAQQGGLFSSLPSYWFLGLFQMLIGSPALAPLARSAVVGLALAILVVLVAYALSYVRTLRRIAEEPDIGPGATRLRWLPAFGTALQTAVVQFSLRTLFRSSPHRLILAFYWGIGFAVTVVALKAPSVQQLATASVSDDWLPTAVPVMASSLLMMACAVIGARLAFAMPRDLQANWIFRVMPVHGGRQYMAARRRALVAVSLIPVWTASAALVFWMWPWRPAVGHLIVLALLGATGVEICLSGTQKIPFTCSYLPGKSRVHVAVYAGLVLVLPAFIFSARLERDALQDTRRYAALVGVLGAAWLFARWRTSWLNDETEPQFEDEPEDQVVRLDVWDSRFRSERLVQPQGDDTAHAALIDDGRSSR